MEPGRDPDFVSQKKRKRHCGGEVAGSSKRFLKMSESEPAFRSRLLLSILKRALIGLLTAFRSGEAVGMLPSQKESVSDRVVFWRKLTLKSLTIGYHIS